jgi:hypothetical protein
MHFQKRTLALSLCLTLLLGLAAPLARAGATTKQVKIRGYITNVISPTSFEIDDYRVTRDETLVFEFENESAELKFKPEDVRVGAEVEIRGAYDEATRELKASRIKIDLEQFRKFKITAVLSGEPEGVEQTPEGWRGAFIADGHRIRVEPSTQVLFKANKSEEKAEKQKQKEQKKEQQKAKDSAAKAVPASDSAAPAEDDEDETAGAQPLASLKDVGVGMLMTYEGTEQPDGTVLAERVVFMRNELEKGEAALWKSLKLKEKPANFAEGKPGELKIDQVGKFKLLPNQEVQDYVANLGRSLIPSYQRRMADDDPQKIPFRFYVVINKDVNAFALPNGIIIVNSGMFNVLEDEGQLAAVLSHEIAHSTQEHTWRQMNKDKKKRTALAIGGLAAAAFGIYGVQTILNLMQAAMINGYQRTLENQADRVGLEYMVEAGYDPRSAPRVWKLMAKKHGDHPTNFFWSSHDNNVTRRSFLMLEIRNNYSQLDLDKMKRGEAADFERLGALVKDAAAKKKKVKVVS